MFLALILIISQLASAEPSLPKTYQHKNSTCTVTSSGGEYPTYIITKNDTPVFEPQSDGIIGVHFSPSGRKIALSAGEVSLIDVKSKSFEFGLVIFDCENNTTTGYRKGLATSVKWWWKEGNGLTFQDGSHIIISKSQKNDL